MEGKTTLLIKRIGDFLNRAWLLAVVAALGFCALPSQEVFRKTHGAVLSRLQPRYYYLTAFLVNKGEMDSKELGEIVHFLRHLRSFLPDSADLLSFLGWSEYYRGDTASAVQTYRQAVASQPEYFWSQYSLAVLLFEQGDYDEAVRRFQRALTLDPQFSLKRVLSSRVYAPFLRRRAMKQGFNFEESFRQAIYKSHLGILLSYEKKQNYADLFNHAAMALQIYGEKTLAPYRFSFYAGRAAYEMKDYAKAVYFLQQAVTQNSQDAQAFYYLGLALQARGQVRYAERALQQAVLLQEKGAPVPDEASGLKPQLF